MFLSPTSLLDLQIIGYFFKKLVKVCDISSASKSTLSSYGHTLMVLYFLQQLETPVIPVLQEVRPSILFARYVSTCHLTSKEFMVLMFSAFQLPHEQETLVNGWNVEYYKNIEGLVSER